MKRERLIPLSVRAVLAFGAGWMGAGCATLFGTSNPDRGTAPCCTTAADALELQYLGTGGWLIRYAGTELLTAPFFTNPSALDLLGSMEPDIAAIDAGLPRVDRVEAILVGHAHYDHLLDVPYVLDRKAPAAHAFGSATMANILAAAPGVVATRIHSVEDSAGSSAERGRWITVASGRVRFMPLLADHAPHFQGIELYEGEVTEPLAELPAVARDWVGGTTLAYLIDFLEPDGSIAYRIHYQDAGSSWPGGVPPQLPAPDDRTADVAILCAPSYGEVESYPEGIIDAVLPRYALVGHWEDFFSPWTRTPQRSVRGSDLDGFTARLDRALPSGSSWTLPNPGDVVRVPPRP